MNKLQKGQSLIGILVTFVILIVAVLFFLKGGFGPKDPENEREDGKGQTTIGKARYAAEDSNCRTQLSQIRGLIMADIGYATDEFPPTLIEINGMPNEDYTTCTIDDEPYDYDSVAGTVTCPHPGHEDY